MRVVERPGVRAEPVQGRARCAASRRVPGGRRLVRRRAARGSMLGLASVQVDEDRAERSGDRVVDVADDPLALARRRPGGAPGPPPRRARVAFVIAIAACFANRLRTATSASVNLLSGWVLNTTQAPMIDPSHSIGTASRGVQPGPVGRDHVATGHLGVASRRRPGRAGPRRRRSCPRSAGRRVPPGTRRRGRPLCDRSRPASSTVEIEPASPPSSATAAAGSARAAAGA